MPPALNFSIRLPPLPGAFDGTNVEQTLSPLLLLCMVQFRAAESVEPARGVQQVSVPTGTPAWATSKLGFCAVLPVTKPIGGQ